MDFHSFYHKMIGAIVYGALFFSVFQVTSAEGIAKTAMYPTLVSMESTFHAVFRKCDKVYADISTGYKKNNTIVTVLPYILRVHILDFFMVLLGILLAFSVVVRYLSR
ncbi:MAG: hypothetical protein PHH16_02625 [Candidatus Gracilibacteria bacterium]|nr:hypothetical protein [Candidatus Gracilibacteria bacterium]